MKRTEEDHLFLLNRIPVGRDNAVHMKDLSAQLGVDDRTIRAWINSARNAGYMILSGNEGYWRSDNTSEIKGSYRRRRRMAMAILRTEREPRRVLSGTEGQITMFTERDEEPGKE